MSQTLHRIRALAATGACVSLVALAPLSGCDQASTDSATSATTTPAANTNAGVDEAADTATDTPVPERDASTNATDRTDRRTQADRSREMQENRGVVFTDDPEEAPRVMLRGDTNQHAGIVYAKAPVEFEFELYNAGKGDLVINNISSSCGCTVPDKKGLINVKFPPGESLPPLEVAYTPRGPGDSNKLVRIFTNDPATPVLRLSVGAELVPLADVEPRRISTGVLRAGMRHEVTFDVMGRDAAMTVESVTARNAPELVFEVQEPQPLEDNELYKVRIPVKVTFPETMLAGRLASAVSIEVKATPPNSSEPVVSPVTTQIFANIEGDVRFTQRFARVNERRPAMPFTFSSSITTLSGRDFEIESVTVRDERTRKEFPMEVAIERLTEAPTPTWSLTFTGETPEAAGAIRGEIIVETDLEGEVPAKMIFTGFVQATPGNRREAGTDNSDARQPLRPDRKSTRLNPVT
jgi:hypothetical protein